MMAFIFVVLWSCYSLSAIAGVDITQSLVDSSCEFAPQSSNCPNWQLLSPTHSQLNPRGLSMRLESATTFFNETNVQGGDLTWCRLQLNGPEAVESKLLLGVFNTVSQRCLGLAVAFAGGSVVSLDLDDTVVFASTPQPLRLMCTSGRFCLPITVNRSNVGSQELRPSFALEEHDSNYIFNVALTDLPPWMTSFGNSFATGGNSSLLTSLQLPEDSTLRESTRKIFLEYSQGASALVPILPQDMNSGTTLLDLDSSSLSLVSRYLPTAALEEVIFTTFNESEFPNSDRPNPTGLLFQTTDNISAKFSLSYRMIEDSWFDIGKFGTEDFAFSLWVKATPQTEGLAFIIGDGWDKVLPGGQVEDWNGPPLGRSLLEVLDSFSLNRGLSTNVDAVGNENTPLRGPLRSFPGALYLNGSSSRVEFVVGTPEEGIQRLVWNKTTLFDNSWHFITLQFRMQKGRRLAQLFLDGETSETKPGWRVCFASRNSYIPKISESPHRTFITDPITQNIHSGGKLSFGIVKPSSSNLGVYQFQIHPRRLLHQEVIGYGTKSMRKFSSIAVTESKVWGITLVSLGSIAVLSVIFFIYAEIWLPARQQRELVSMEDARGRGKKLLKKARPTEAYQRMVRTNRRVVQATKSVRYANRGRATVKVLSKLEIVLPLLLSTFQELILFFEGIEWPLDFQIPLSRILWIFSLDIDVAFPTVPAFATPVLQFLATLLVCIFFVRVGWSDTRRFRQSVVVARQNYKVMLERKREEIERKEKTAAMPMRLGSDEITIATVARTQANEISQPAVSELDTLLPRPVRYPQLRVTFVFAPIYKYKHERDLRDMIATPKSCEQLQALLDTLLSRDEQITPERFLLPVTVAQRRTFQEEQCDSVPIEMNEVRTITITSLELQLPDDLSDDSRATSHLLRSGSSTRIAKVSYSEGVPVSEDEMRSSSTFSAFVTAEVNTLRCPMHKSILIPLVEGHHTSVTRSSDTKNEEPYSCAAAGNGLFRLFRSPVCDTQLFTCTVDNCGYSLCKSCSSREMISSLRVSYHQFRYRLRRTQAGQLIGLITILIAEAMYLPIVKTSLMLASCHQKYQCDFPRCYAEPLPYFVWVVTASIGTLLTLGIGLVFFEIGLLVHRKLLIVNSGAWDEYLIHPKDVWAKKNNDPMTLFTAQLDKEKAQEEHLQRMELKRRTVLLSSSLHSSSHNVGDNESSMNETDGIPSGLSSGSHSPFNPKDHGIFTRLFCGMDDSIWRAVLADDRTMLKGLYEQYEFHHMCIHPVFLIFKTLIIAAVVLSPPGTLTQLLATGGVEGAQLLFLIGTNAFIEPWLDVAARLGSTHQVLQLGLLSLHRVIVEDNPNAKGLGVAMIVVSITYVVLIVIVVTVDVIVPAVKAHRENKKQKEAHAKETIRESERKRTEEQRLGKARKLAEALVSRASDWRQEVSSAFHAHAESIHVSYGSEQSLRFLFSLLGAQVGLKSSDTSSVASGRSSPTEQGCIQKISFRSRCVIPEVWKDICTCLRLNKTLTVLDFTGNRVPQAFLLPFCDSLNHHRPSLKELFIPKVFSGDLEPGEVQGLNWQVIDSFSKFLRNTRTLESLDLSHAVFWFPYGLVKNRSLKKLKLECITFRPKLLPSSYYDLIQRHESPFLNRPDSNDSMQVPQGEYSTSESEIYTRLEEKKRQDEKLRTDLFFDSEEEVGAAFCSHVASLVQHEEGSSLKALSIKGTKISSAKQLHTLLLETPDNELPIEDLDLPSVLTTLEDLSISECLSDCTAASQEGKSIISIVERFVSLASSFCDSRLESLDLSGNPCLADVLLDLVKNACHSSYNNSFSRLKVARCSEGAQVLRDELQDTLYDILEDSPWKRDSFKLILEEETLHSLTYWPECYTSTGKLGVDCSLTHEDFQGKWVAESSVVLTKPYDDINIASSEFSDDGSPSLSAEKLTTLKRTRWRHRLDLDTDRLCIPYRCLLDVETLNPPRLLLTHLEFQGKNGLSIPALEALLFKNLARFERLTHLALVNNRLPPQVLSFLQEAKNRNSFPQLKSLDLSDNFMLGETTTGVLRLFSDALTEIALSGNDITEEGVLILSNRLKASARACDPKDSLFGKRVDEMEETNTEPKPRSLRLLHLSDMRLVPSVHQLLSKKISEGDQPWRASLDEEDCAAPGSFKDTVTFSHFFDLASLARNQPETSLLSEATCFMTLLESLQGNFELRSLELNSIGLCGASLELLMYQLTGRLHISSRSGTKASRRIPVTHLDIGDTLRNVSGSLHPRDGHAIRIILQECSDLKSFIGPRNYNLKLGDTALWNPDLKKLSLGGSAENLPDSSIKFDASSIQELDLRGCEQQAAALLKLGTLLSSTQSPLRKLVVESEGDAGADFVLEALKGKWPVLEELSVDATYIKQWKFKTAASKWDTLWQLIHESGVRSRWNLQHLRCPLGYSDAEAVLGLGEILRLNRSLSTVSLVGHLTIDGISSIRRCLRRNITLLHFDHSLHSLLPVESELADPRNRSTMDILKERQENIARLPPLPELSPPTLSERLSRLKTPVTQVEIGEGIASVGEAGGLNLAERQQLFADITKRNTKIQYFIEEYSTMVGNKNQEVSDVKRTYIRNNLMEFLAPSDWSHQWSDEEQIPNPVMMNPHEQKYCVRQRDSSISIEFIESFVDCMLQSKSRLKEEIARARWCDLQTIEDEIRSEAKVSAQAKFSKIKDKLALLTVAKRVSGKKRKE